MQEARPHQGETLESSSRTCTQGSQRTTEARAPIVTTNEANELEHYLEQVVEAVPPLSLVISNPLKIQVKQEVVEAIFDSASQKNLLSQELVDRLGLEVKPHPNPSALGWFKQGERFRYKINALLNLL